jgi:hypothetical protein
MMTQDEVKRWAGKFDGSAVVDPDLKPEILKEHLRDAIHKIETTLRRSSKRTKVVVFFGEMK